MIAPSPRRLRRTVLPVVNPRGIIGTATVVAPGRALTALHVITRERLTGLRLGTGHPVMGVRSLPLADYGGARESARRSWQRARRLVLAEVVTVLGTVDLALLVVPGLAGPAVRPRGHPVQVGECVTVPGYPGGRWSVNRGPVSGADDADFAVRMLLGPGASGAPVLDLDNRLAGVVTLDHASATICIGPRLVSTFLRLTLV